MFYFFLLFLKACHQEKVWLQTNITIGYLILLLVLNSLLTMTESTNAENTKDFSSNYMDTFVNLTLKDQTPL